MGRKEECIKELSRILKALEANIMESPEAAEAILGYIIKVKEVLLTHELYNSHSEKEDPFVRTCLKNLDAAIEKVLNNDLHHALWSTKAIIIVFINSISQDPNAVGMT